MKSLQIRIIITALFAFIAVVKASEVVAQTRTELTEANKHIGERVSVCGTIISVKHLYNVKGKPILVNLGNVTQHLDVVIAAEDSTLEYLSGDSLQYKDACVTGKIYYFKGTEHVYLKAENIKLKQLEIVASSVFKQTEADQINTLALLSATKKSNVRKSVIIDSKKPGAAETALLIKYIKIGKIVSYKESKGKKTYVVLLKEYKKN